MTSICNQISTSRVSHVLGTKIIRLCLIPSIFDMPTMEQNRLILTLPVHDLTPRPDPLNPPVYTNSGSTGQYQLRAKPSPSNIKTHRPDIMSEHYQFDIKCRLDGSEIWTGFTKSNTKCRISGQTTCLALCDL